MKNSTVLITPEEVNSISSAIDRLCRKKAIERLIENHKDELEAFYEEEKIGYYKAGMELLGISVSNL